MNLKSELLLIIVTGWSIRVEEMNSDKWSKMKARKTHKLKPKSHVYKMSSSIIKFI
jgi:hypothetical protein